MKVLTTGSRTWTGVLGGERINAVLYLLEGLATVLESPLRLMNGACPQGADKLVQRWADINDVPLEEFPADWLGLGKPAGFVRNQFMVNQGADMCIAFLRDNSRGTLHTIERARAAGIPTFVVPWQTSTTDGDHLPLVT
jgi:Protein of unknown function (DUF2493).